ALLATGGYMLMPFGSAFTVNNLGIHVEKLPLIYLITGISAIVIGPVVGRLSDRYGKFNVFICGSLMSMVMVFIYTHLGVTSLPLVILVNVLMFMGIFSRMIPSQALMSAVPEPASRGSFMSVSSSLQQVSGGFASVIAGLIVVQQGNNAPLEHFDKIGYVIIGASAITLFMMYQIHKAIPEKRN
ncbi:MAG: MFS transporter, partial [Bdellovibrionota bacterium]